MMRPTWHVLRRDGRRALPAVEVTGPAIDDLVHSIITDLADAIITGCAEAWTNYLVAYSNLANASDPATDGPGLEALEDAAADAWDTLVPDLPRTVRLHLAEARMLAGALDEAAGRVGERAA